MMWMVLDQQPDCMHMMSMVLVRRLDYRHNWLFVPSDVDLVDDLNVFVPFRRSLQLRRRENICEFFFNFFFAK